MDKNRIAAIKIQFDEIIHIISNADVEYWLARELMPLLGYERWENFEKAVKRSMESCETAAMQKEISKQSGNFRLMKYKRLSVKYMII